LKKAKEKKNFCEIYAKKTCFQPQTPLPLAVAVLVVYLPSCLGQETAMWPFWSSSQGLPAGESFASRLPLATGGLQGCWQKNFQGGCNGKKTNNSKQRLKNTTVKPVSTISVPCMKIRERHGPCRCPWRLWAQPSEPCNWPHDEFLAIRLIVSNSILLWYYASCSLSPSRGSYFWKLFPLQNFCKCQVDQNSGK